MAINQTADRVKQLKYEAPEEEEMSITKELQLLIPQSFVTTFFGRPQDMSLLCHFDFFQNSNLNLLGLCFKMKEDDQQEDASLYNPLTLTKKLFHSVLTFNLNINTIEKPQIKKKKWQSFQKHYRNKHDGSTRQHGLAIIFLEGDEKVFYVPKPVYRKNKNHDHVEQILARDIHNFLQQNEKNKGPKVKFILIYTYNSPCLKGKKMNIDGCMFKLLVLAHEWHRKYGIFTNVLFTEYWGPIGDGSPLLRDLGHLQQFNITFPLDSKIMSENLNKIKEEQLHTLHNDENRPLSDFQSAKDHLLRLIESNDSLTTQQHLASGEEIIAFLEGQEKIYDNLLNNWQDGVENCFKKHFKAVCNTAIVKCFIENLESILGSSSPIKFHQIPQSLLV